MPSEKPQRISIGFHGQVLAARVAPAELTRLREALGSEGWFELAAEDGKVVLDLTKVIYVQVDQDEPRVGFGS